MPRLVASEVCSPSEKDVEGEIISNPTPNDILPGRGKHVYSHQGNNFFLSLVKKYEFRNVSCPKSLKPVYARAIYSCIRNLDPPGRFLKPVSPQDSEDRWCEMTSEEAMTKIRQAMRDNTSRINRKKKNSEKKMRNFSNMFHQDVEACKNVAKVRLKRQEAWQNVMHNNGSKDFSTMPGRGMFLYRQMRQPCFIPMYQNQVLHNMHHQSIVRNHMQGTSMYPQHVVGAPGKKVIQNQIV